MTTQTPGSGSRPDPVEEVRAAMTVLHGLDGRPTAAHVAAFDRVHTALTDALAAIDEV